MYRSLFLVVLLSAALTACKPTKRTAVEAQHRPAATEAAVEPMPEPEPSTPVVQQAEPANAILTVNAARQQYNTLLPWQKKEVSNASVQGVYLGDGKVLTVGAPLVAATYAELALPDGSARVPARVLRCDAEMNLALLTVADEKDMKIFEGRTALALGAPLAIGDSAELIGLADGRTPVHRTLTVRGSEGERTPLLRLELPNLPCDDADGAPILRHGKLAALGLRYDESGTLFAVNGELLRRFCETEQTGLPLNGFSIDYADNPVLSRYLKLGEGESGLYVNKVIPGGSAAAAGLKAGDVIIAIDGAPIRPDGRMEHPLYGSCSALSLLRVLKPLGETVTLRVRRDGEPAELTMELNRELTKKGLTAIDPPDRAPRYIIWGGLVFQPLTDTYLKALEKSRRGLSRPYRRLMRSADALAEQGITEPVGLTLVIPTPADVGYEENASFSLVTAVNGKPVHNFDEFAALLDEPTEDNITRISLSETPYEVYIDRAAAEAANDSLRRTAIPTLRVTGRE